MRRVVFKMVGTGPLVFGKRVFDGKRPDETHEQYEERTWLGRCSTDEDGDLALSGFAIHRAIVWAGKWLNEKLEGKKTYTKRLECGMSPESAFFKVRNGKSVLTPDDCEKMPLDVPSDGKRGGGRRVTRNFPRLKAGWWCEVSMLVLDEAITEDVLRRHIETAGMYDGMGSMRVGTGGGNGRFTVKDLKMELVRA